jgi:hypothetical protein
MPGLDLRVIAELAHILGETEKRVGDRRRELGLFGGRSWRHSGRLKTLDPNYSDNYQVRPRQRNQRSKTVRSLTGIESPKASERLRSRLAAEKGREICSVKRGDKQNDNYRQPREEPSRICSPHRFMRRGGFVVAFKGHYSLARIAPRPAQRILDRHRVRGHRERRTQATSPRR